MSDPSAIPPGWYDDPEAPGRPRWWNGQEWGPPAVPTAPGYGYLSGHKPADLVAEAGSAKTAKLFALVNIGAGAVTALSSVVIGAGYGDFFRDALDTTSRSRGRGSAALAQFEMPTSVLVASGIQQLTSLVALAAMIVLFIWLHRSLTNARALGLPLRRSPGWAVGSFFIPIVNLWFPYQSVCDLFPAGHPRGLVLRWWLAYLFSSVAGGGALVVAFFSVPAALAVAAVAVALYAVAGLAIREVIVAAGVAHNELATQQGIPTGAAPVPMPPAPGVPSASPSLYDAGPYGAGPGQPDPWAAPPAPPRDPWNP